MSLEKIIKNIIKISEENDEEEVCGIIYKSKNKFFFKECINMANNKKHEFIIGDSDYIDIYNKGEIACIFHSHICGSNGLSKYDILNSEYLNIPFLMYEKETKKLYINEIEGSKYLKSLKKTLSCVI